MTSHRSSRWRMHWRCNLYCCSRAHTERRLPANASSIARNWCYTHTHVHTRLRPASPDRLIEVSNKLRWYIRCGFIIITSRWTYLTNETKLTSNVLNISAALFVHEVASTLLRYNNKKIPVLLLRHPSKWCDIKTVTLGILSTRNPNKWRTLELTYGISM